MANSAAPQMAAPESERGLACLAYLFLWLTGLIVLLTAKKEEKYKRWHAIQAIALGIAVTIIVILLNILFAVMFATAGAGGALGGFGIMSLVNLLILVLVIIMMIQTYQGKTIRLPVLAGFADKNA